MTELKFEPGAWIFRTGDASVRAYLVGQGEVELLSETGGTLARVAIVNPGNVFGEMSLVEERPHSLGARALTPVTVAALTRDEFEALLTSNPAKTRLYLRTLFERLRSLSARIAELSDSIPMADAVPEGPVAFPAIPGQEINENAPTVVVHPLTRKAAETLPDEGLWVTSFPLRIGRAPGANEPDSLDLNDLWLLDEKPYNVSRNHCEIALDDKNRVLVRDRGSHVGCIVNEQVIGGRAPYGYTRLHSGDNVMILGGRMSPYQFRVTVG